MKIGSTIILIIVIFIAFGYVISDDFQVRNDLNEVNQRLNSCQNAILDDQKIIDDLENRNVSLTNLVAEKDNEIASIKSENGMLRGENEVLKQENHSLKEENKNLLSKQHGEPIIENDQIVLAGIVIAQALITFFYKSRRLGLKKIKKNANQKGEYVYLSPEERALLISLRRKTK